jgi:glycosyltransferase involved in cell wall biosynthesis
VLVVHQSAELYGSDRSLLEVLSGIDRARFECIVCLPEHGPLEYELRRSEFEVHVLPLVKVGRAMFSVGGLLHLPGQIRSAILQLDGVLQGRRVDLVYTNTLAVLAGAFWAFFRRRPHVWHVREIIRKPAFVSVGFRFLAQRFSTRLICNSKGTQAWVDSGVAARHIKSAVIWNGVDSGAPPADESTKKTSKLALGLNADLPLVLMMGRVNAWKGQDLLLDAVDQIYRKGIDAFQLALVGGPPPGQEQWMDNLRARVAHSPLAGKIHVQAFTPEVLQYYQAADMLVVPSREPEPFGRVAIEGMAAGLPIIAADHGGLSEIVESGTSGLLFKPNSTDQLASALEALIADAGLRQSMGRNARLRQENVFSLAACRSAVFQVFEDVYGS